MDSLASLHDARVDDWNTEVLSGAVGHQLKVLTKLVERRTFDFNDLDMWLHNRTGPRPRFMCNQTNPSDKKQSDNFIAIQLRGTRSNRDAIGCRVEIVVADMSAGSLAKTL